MSKYKVRIERVEYYSVTVLVDAKDENEAMDKVEEKWRADDYLYEKMTDFIDDSKTDFIPCGKATRDDLRNFTHI